MGTQDQPQATEGLLGILRELEVQDEKSILRSLRSLGASRPISEVDALTQSTTWLSKIEKHILAVHKDEVAKLLENECLRLFLAGPSHGIPPMPNRDPKGRKILPMESAGFCEKRDRVCNGLPTDVGLEQAQGLLCSLIPGAPDDPSRLLEVAEVAYLLRPSESLSLYIARGEELAGAYGAARERLGDAYREPCFYKNKLTAAAALGRCYSDENEKAQAVNWRRKSATGCEPFAVGALSWFSHAICFGTRSDCEDAVHVLSTDYEATDPVFAEGTRQLRAALFTGQWQVPPGTRQRVLRMSETSFEHVEAIKNLFL